jgi:uncharacterized lipoprotein
MIMRYSILVVAVLFVLALSACERTTTVVEPKAKAPDTVIVTPVPGPEGPQGPQGKTGDEGDKGEQGKKGNTDSD